MIQIVLALTSLIIALTLLVLALTELMHRIASRIPTNPSVEKHFAYQWLFNLGAMLRAAGDFFRAANRRQIHDRKRKKKSDSD